MKKNVTLERVVLNLGIAQAQSPNSKHAPLHPCCCQPHSFFLHRSLLFSVGIFHLYLSLSLSLSLTHTQSLFRFQKP